MQIVAAFGLLFCVYCLIQVLAKWKSRSSFERVIWLAMIAAGGWWCLQAFSTTDPAPVPAQTTISAPPGTVANAVPPRQETTSGTVDLRQVLMAHFDSWVTQYPALNREAVFNAVMRRSEMLMRNGQDPVAAFDQAVQEIAPRYSTPKDVGYANRSRVRCVFKSAMTDEEIAACKATSER
jgi:hypothetical protein